ncbi:MAG: hypothetical protein COA94_07805 [Rickettsiales bacterium]|nr:MAG: hypothetical protein COA94_07805 [Rickettsiales bacterium]
MGGADVEFTGQMFNPQTENNFVKIKSRESDDRARTFAQTYTLSGKDIFIYYKDEDISHSNAGLGKLVWRSPPLADLLGMTEPHHLNTSFSLWLEYYRNHATTDITCNGGQGGCSYTSSWKTTPFNFGVIPHTFGYKQRVSAWLQGRHSASYKSD